MPELVLTTLKFLFLGLLYLFVGRAIRVIWLDLAGPRPARQRKTDQRSVAYAPPRRQRAGARLRKVASLIVTEDGMKPRTHPVAGSPVTIGRSNECTIPLHDTYVSQMHTRIFARDGDWFVEDLGSTNGTYLNGMKVADPTPVSPGDEVRLGKTMVRVSAR